MVNQQLLDYIKQQLQQGISREQIKNSLIAKGWLEQDIEEGFNSTNAPTPLEQYSNLPTKAPMKLWKIILVSCVVILIVGGGIYFAFQESTKPTEESNDESSGQLTQEFQLSLGISTPKDTYKVSEKFTGGKYLLTYNGDPFSAIVLYKKSRKDFEDKSQYSKIAGVIRAGDFDNNSILREALQAFKMDETEYSAGKNSFSEAGEYMFTISIYKCSDIDLGDKDCEARTSTDLILSAQPLDSISKVIMVVEDVTQPGPEQDPSGETVLDCIGVEDPQCIMNYLDLFKQNLQSCKASKGTTVIGWEPAFGLYRGYEIVGIQNDLCVINFWFLEIEEIPASLLNKQMNCKYSDSERTIKKVAGADNCAGPLLDEFNSLLGR